MTHRRWWVKRGAAGCGFCGGPTGETRVTAAGKARVSPVDRRRKIGHPKRMVGFTPPIVVVKTFCDS